MSHMNHCLETMIYNLFSLGKNREIYRFPINLLIGSTESTLYYSDYTIVTIVSNQYTDSIYRVL